MSFFEAFSFFNPPETNPRVARLFVDLAYRHVCKEIYGSPDARLSPLLESVWRASAEHYLIRTRCDLTFRGFP